MRFLVLGPLEVADDGHRIALGSRAQRVILAMLLAARGRPVSADQLSEAVWEGRPPPSAHKSLHSHVSRLRRTLAAAAPDGAGAVATEGDGYRVDLDRHRLDADEFEALVSACRLDEALRLWRGPAFGDLAELEPVRPEAVRLAELHAAAAADRIDERLAAGKHQAVIGELEKTVAAEPLAERPHAQLMTALYRSGRQADALAVHRRLQHRLGEELGIDPSREIQQLHERILRQDAVLAPPVRPASGPEGPPALPGIVASGRLFGRDEDVAAVARLVAGAGLTTLTGPGGVGKSRLAETAAAEVGERFDDGAVWCPLAAVRDPAALTEALVSALRVRQEGDRSAQDSLLAALGTRRLLLVLDNCEHLLDAIAEIVEAIRSRCPHVTVLATSREHLHLPGERVWEVTPLPVPGADADLAQVTGTPAGALFCARAAAVEPSFAPTDDDAATVAALCRRLDGMPLAIELAASRVRALALETLAARIDQRFELLTGGSHRESGRHRTLHAMVDWSYDLLGETEARLFDRLSVFASAFPLEAAEEVCAGEPIAAREVVGLLSELVDKSLVAVDRSDGQVRYRLLETLRAYGVRRLEEAGAADAAERAHARYHVRLAEDLGERVRGPDERAALARLDAAFDDLRVAHARLASDDDADGALRLPSALHDDLLFRPRHEVFEWVERALELPGAPEQPAFPAAQVTAALGAMNRGEIERARRLAEEALADAEPGDLVALRAHWVLGAMGLYQGSLDEGPRTGDLEPGRGDYAGQDYHRTLAAVGAALIQAYRGNLATAEGAASRARDAAEASGNHTARAWARYVSGEVLLDTDPEQAATFLEQAVDAARRVDRRFIEGVALVSLASLYGRRGRTDRALALFRETIALWRQLGGHVQQQTTLRNLVELLVDVGADEAAAVLHGAVVGSGATPSYGAEADRVAAAWDRLTKRLGSAAADAAAERGRCLTADQAVDEALARLDALLEERRTTAAGRSG